MMLNEDVGSAPVCEGDKVLGMITDRDIVIRAIALGKDPKSTKVGDVMSTNVVYVSPEADVHEASDKMAMYQVRRLPVIDQGKLVGVVSLGDVALEHIHTDEAGEALGEICEPVNPH